jgi:hypothetical protein
MTRQDLVDSTTTRPAPDTRALIELALEALPRMQLPDGLFCWERRAGDPAPHGRSHRYTLMVLLGLERARAAGYEIALDIDRIHAAMQSELDSPELAPGDFGLLLWLDARTQGDRAEDLLARLDRSLSAAGGLGTREGMEVGWTVTGLAHQVAGGNEAARPALKSALDQLLGPNLAPSGLFRHYGDGRRRARFPNFATQIYAVLALAVAGRHGLDDRALPAARTAADRLLALQLPDGGWPWLFDAERGSVVERYEIYCVHQHAMAPMAMFELSEATGEGRYAAAAAAGLSWIAGNNELGADMVAPGEGLVFRSIRRRRPFDRIGIATNTGTALTVGRSRAGQSKRTEINRTDRPYSFGWILDAWAGREDAGRSA